MNDLNEALSQRNASCLIIIVIIIIFIEGAQLAKAVFSGALPRPCDVKFVLDAPK